jgi:ArsR family transcriptional regulator
MTPSGRRARAINRREAERIAEVGKALADPWRIRIIDLLANAEEPMSVGEITAALRAKQPTVSHHLGILREIGVVATERQWRTIRYTLRPEALDRLRRWLP